MNILTIINVLFLVGTSSFFLVMIYASLEEKEHRATIISIISLFMNIGVWSSFLKYSNIESVKMINIMSLIFGAIFALFSLIKWFPAKEDDDLEKIEQYDERDQMFARNNLQNSKTNFDKYYKKYPDKKTTDKKIHKLPNLGSGGSRFYDDLISPFINAIDSFTASTKAAMDTKPEPKKKKVDPVDMTALIKKAGVFLGAVDVGVTKLQKHHFYSHHGRKTDSWGKKIKKTHKHAIVFLVKMSESKLKFAPSLPELLESTSKYTDAAKIAHTISNFCKNLGYDAKAQFDGMYEVLCVPLAHDAGLGEVGRMGLLMHPVYGPCIRISVVTTDMPLMETKGKDHHIESFCEICKKCADNCPSRSVEKDKKGSSRGVKHWFINQEACFTFWKHSGHVLHFGSIPAPTVVFV